MEHENTHFGLDSLSFSLQSCAADVADGEVLFKEYFGSEAFLLYQSIYKWKHIRLKIMSNVHDYVSMPSYPATNNSSAWHEFYIALHMLLMDNKD